MRIPGFPGSRLDNRLTGQNSKIGVMYGLATTQAQPYSWTLRCFRVLICPDALNFFQMMEMMELG